MREHGSVLLYVHGNHTAREEGKPRPATSTLTQLLNSIVVAVAAVVVLLNVLGYLLTY